MTNQVSTKSVVVACVVFSFVLPFCGALGIYYHAAAESGVIFLTAYFLYRKGFSIRQLAIIQLPILLFILGLVLYNHLYNTIHMAFCFLGSFLLFPLYVYVRKQASLVPILFITSVLVLSVYVFNGRFIYRLSINPIAESHVSINDVEIVDSANIDFKFPNDDKIYVIELWSTSCGICFKRMPDFELFEQHFADENRVVCRLLYLPLKQDTLNQAKQMLEDRGVKVQSLYAKHLDSWKQLNAEGVPHILLIRNGYLLESHNGRSINYSTNLLLPDIEQRVEELLKKL